MTQDRDIYALHEPGYARLGQVHYEILELIHLRESREYAVKRITVFDFSITFFADHASGAGAKSASRESPGRSAVPFRFRKASCVVAGTFNVYIFHPQWLIKHQIIEPTTEFGILTNLARPGFRFDIPKLEIVLSVAPDRIVIESEDRHTDLGQIAAKILTALPETPLFAIGNNGTYDVNRDEFTHLLPSIRNFPQPEELDECECISQNTFHFGMRRNEREVVNLQLSIKEDTVELACNMHAKLEDHAEANQAAVDIAERFFQDRKLSERLAHHCFGARIADDSNNL